MKISDSAGFDYLEKSNWERDSIRSLERATVSEVAPFKTYPNNKSIPLSLSWNLTEARITPLIQKRRSLRKYSDKPLTLKDISFLLWASQGITAKAGEHFFRSSPSAGALYPFETYVFVDFIDGLEKGIYHFNVEDFSLELLEEGEISEKLASACLNQKFIKAAPVTFVWSGVLSRCFGKYGERALRYLLLDIGHVCQNTLTGAEAVGAGGCPIASFFDDELNDLLKLDTSDEMCLYAASFGRKESTD